MRKLIISVAGVALCAAMTVGIVFDFRARGAAQTRQAVEQVFQARGIAMREWLVRGPAYFPRRFFNEISGIDTSLCPQDFRSAWVDYVEAWKMHTDPVARLGHFTEATYGARNRSESLAADGVRRMQEADIEDTFTKCEKIAIAYGCAVPGN